MAETALNLGRVRINFTDEFDILRQYLFFDSVLYEGSSYLVNNRNELPPIGTLPTDTRYWLLIAKNGEIDKNISDLNNYYNKSDSEKNFIKLNTVNDDNLYNGNVWIGGNNTNLYSGKVYNAVNADYAECFNNTDLNYKDVVNLIVQINNDERLELATYNSKRVIGIVSDNYGHLLNGTEDDIINNKKLPVGMAGTLYVKTKDKLDTNNLGNYIISENDGYATVVENKNDFNVVGKIIGFDFENNRYKVVI